MTDESEKGTLTRRITIGAGATPDRLEIRRT